MVAEAAAAHAFAAVARAHALAQCASATAATRPTPACLTPPPPLQARGFDAEVILAAFDDTALPIVLNLLHSARRLGLEHVLLLADTQESCEKLFKAEKEIGARVGVWACRLCVHVPACCMCTHVSDM